MDLRDAAARDYEEALKFWKRLAARVPADIEIQEQLAICHRVLGSFHAVKKEFAKVKEHREAALAIAERLERENRAVVRHRWSLAKSRSDLGDYYRDVGNIEAAAKLYEQAI